MKNPVDFDSDALGYADAKRRHCVLNLVMKNK